MTSFEELYREEYSRLVSHACRSLPTRCEAEDLVQDAFVGLWENRESVPNPRGYLWRTAHNMLCSWWEKHRAHNGLRLSVELKDVPFDASLDAGLMAEWAMGRLTNNQRALMFAKYAGYENAEIADMLGVSLGGAKARISRARERVRRAGKGV